MRYNRSLTFAALYRLGASFVKPHARARHRTLMHPTILHPTRQLPPRLHSLPMPPTPMTMTTTTTMTQPPQSLYSLEPYGELNPYVSYEWLLTNGLGGFAFSSVVGCNTRRYHGLLCSA